MLYKIGAYFNTAASVTPAPRDKNCYPFLPELSQQTTFAAIC